MASLVAVRYGRARHLAYCKVDEAGLKPLERLILRTERGVEVGVFLSKLTRVPPYLNKCEGTFLRRVNSRDEEQLNRIEHKLVPEEFGYCRRKIEELGLEMKLVDVDHLFGGNKVVFYYTAEKRVDYRQLVKLLAGRFRTRIEMRQIGARDAARVVGDFQNCGRPLCCRSVLFRLPQVTVKMAKAQGRNLDPRRNLGACGRLKCCLRFELDEEPRGRGDRPERKGKKGRREQEEKREEDEPTPPPPPDAPAPQADQAQP